MSCVSHLGFSGVLLQERDLLKKYGDNAEKVAVIKVLSRSTVGAALRQRPQSASGSQRKLPSPTAQGGNYCLHRTLHGIFSLPAIAAVSSHSPPHCLHVLLFKMCVGYSWPRPGAHSRPGRGGGE